MRIKVAVGNFCLLLAGMLIGMTVMAINLRSESFNIASFLVLWPISLLVLGLVGAAFILHSEELLK